MSSRAVYHLRGAPKTRSNQCEGSYWLGWTLDSVLTLHAWLAYTAEEDVYCSHKEVVQTTSNVITMPNLIDQ